MQNNSKKQYKKRKRRDGESLEDFRKGWTQCWFYLQNKRRLCNVQRAKGSNYCGIHRHEADGSGAKTVPCPVDNSHSVLESNLKKHLHICNAAIALARLRKKPYFCEDCNTGGAPSHFENLSTEGMFSLFILWLSSMLLMDDWADILVSTVGST